MLFNQERRKGDDMKGRSILSHVCVLIAGAFLGIWMDYSAWHNKVGVAAAGLAGQDLRFDLEDNKEARLEVNIGDKITLVSNAGNAKNPRIIFTETPAPCTGGISSNPCQIANLDKKLYHFHCSSDNGLNCLDPAIQQSGSSGRPLGILNNLSYPGAVKRAFASLIGR